MPWNFRRSVNLGPFRINASKSGLGYSVGVRGFRVGKDAKGRTYTAASIPDTGIYRRDYLRKAAPQNQAGANVSATPTLPVPGAASNKIRTWPNVRVPVWLAYVGGAILLYLVIRGLS
jgi:hypothetical protein